MTDPQTGRPLAQGTLCRDRFRKKKGRNAQVTPSPVRHSIPDQIRDTPENAMSAWPEAGPGRENERD